MPAKRPRADVDLHAAARGLTGEALDALAAIMRTGSSEHARIAAASAILDRGFGKVRQETRPGGEEVARIVHVIRWAESACEATPDPIEETRTRRRS